MFHFTKTWRDTDGNVYTGATVLLKFIEFHIAGQGAYQTFKYHFDRIISLDIA